MADAITYRYNDEGQPVAVVIDGKEEELGSRDRDRIPGREVAEVTDVKTSIRSPIEEMKDSYDGNSILVDMAATHGGYSNGNNYFYLTDGMKKSVTTWTKPFGKPYLSNHDMRSDPLGRVKDAKFVSTGPDTGFHQLDTLVSDPEEIDRIIGERSLTVSVGSIPIKDVECSVCSHDLFSGGNTPKRYEIDSALDEAWLDQKAPGIFGRFGYTNRKLWDYNKDEDTGKVTCRCRHIRGIESPHTDGSLEESDWYLHQQLYREVSRVNLPADQNDDTGEFAHIREVLKQTDGMDADTRLRVMEERLSRVDRGGIDRVRHTIASEKDLWRPNDPSEALDFIRGGGQIFDQSQWQAVCAMVDSEEQQVKAFMEGGGRFVGEAPSNNVMSVADAFQLGSARAFGQWLRSQQDLSRQERKQLDELYFQTKIRPTT